MLMSYFVPLTTHSILKTYFFGLREGSTGFYVEKQLFYRIVCAADGVRIPEILMEIIIKKHLLQSDKFLLVRTSTVQLRIPYAP